MQKGQVLRGLGRLGRQGGLFTAVSLPPSGRCLERPSAVFSERCWTGGIVIAERFRLGKVNVRKSLWIAVARRPITVGYLVMQHEEKWFVRGFGLHETNAELAGEPCRVAGEGECACRRLELWIPLARQDNPAVEASRPAAQVPLPNHDSVIARCLQPLGNSVPASIKLI